MFDFDALSRAIASRTVLCVGDLMLDEFVYGEVSRISPEAPAPVIAVQRSETNIGGAGNVARNIAALGARCIFVGLVGEDEAGVTLQTALAKLGAVAPELVVEQGRPTTRKVRFVSEHHSTHLMRADWETAAPASAQSEAELIAYAEAALPQVGAVVLSDYAKGVLTPRVISAVIEAARRLGKPVIVDPKGHDYTLYSGATLITPNVRELAAAVHRPVGSEAEVANAAAELAHMLGCEAVLVTQRSGHDLACGRRGAGPRARLPGQGARCVGRRRYRGGHDGGAARHADAVRSGDARRQCGSGRRRRQARHRDRVAGRAAPPHPAGRHARARGQNRVRLVGHGRAPRRMAPPRYAHRLHQRLLRSVASRPYPAVGRSARRL